MEVRAHAKINWALRVTGKRADGYHDIESLVAFAGIGDRVALYPGPEADVTTSGPFAAEPSHLPIGQPGPRSSS